MNQKTPPVEELSYEQAFSELVKIISDLETEAYTLDESLNFFERGQALVKHCSTLLENAELKIQQLVGEDFTEFDAD